MNNRGIGTGGCCLAVSRQPFNEDESMFARYARKYDNQRSLYAYFPHLPRERLLIRDTMETKQKAVSEGATHFDTLSFSRNPYTGIPRSWFYGDFYINVLEPDRLNERNQFQFIQQIVSHFFMKQFGIDPSLVGFVLFETGGIGVRIPAWVLRLEEGAYLLPYIYLRIASILDRYFKCSGLGRFIVHYNPKIGAGSLEPDFPDSEEFDFAFSPDGKFDYSKRISMAGITKIKIEAQRQKESELIAERFQQCPFLKGQLRSISGNKGRITDHGDAIPVYGMHSVAPKFLRGILVKISKELGLGASMDEWITPGFASVCERLQTTKRCKPEISCRCHVT